jgi:hypothetical protein
MSTDLNYDNELLGGNEFVFMQRVGGDGEPEFIGGGYKVNSFFLNAGESPMKTINNDNTQDGGKVSTPFENLAVPAGVFFINQRIKKTNTDSYSKDRYKNHEMLPDDIFDKLFGLVEVDKKRKRKTRKHIKKSKPTNNKTHKQK